MLSLSRRSKMTKREQSTWQSNKSLKPKEEKRSRSWKQRGYVKRSKQPSLKLKHRSKQRKKRLLNWQQRQKRKRD